MDELSAESIKRGLKTDLIGRSIVYYSSIGSTNEALKELAAQSAPEGTLVIADGQTAGLILGQWYLTELVQQVLLAFGQE